MILTVNADYIRHGDQARCAMTRTDVVVGTLKEAWAAMHVPGHRMWRMEILSVDGLPFAEWHKNNPLPVRWPTVDPPKPSKSKKRNLS